MSSVSISSSTSNLAAACSTEPVHPIPVDPKHILRVGGVPEHFNMPWFLGQEQQIFARNGVGIQWNEYKLGTGQMIGALKAGEVDLIVALTEGLVADIAQGSDLRLVGTYVESPLCWAISTGPDSPIQEVADLKGQSIGISRYTSGSHLMSCVLASQRGWSQNELKFVVEGSFENLRKSVREQRTAAFMWETFTTKPYHDSGEVRRVGEIVTPWPCFLLCSRKDILADPVKRQTIEGVLKSIQESCRNFKSTPSMYCEVARRYGNSEADAKAWYEGVNITGSTIIYESTLEQTIQALKDAGILTAATYPKDKPLEEFVDTGFVTLEADIKSMRLYHKPELLTALWNNIRFRLKKERGPLKFTELLPFDQNHYGGIDALDVCAKECHLTKDSRLLQLGSSVGGPSRYLAGTYGCEVLACELQEDLHGCARELTQRCGLDQQVHHLAGNFLSLARHLSPNSYDAIASWLTILHFDREERARLYASAFAILKPGGIFYADDFFEAGPFTTEERRTLRHDVFCKYLPTLAVYGQELQAAGFELVKLQDITQEWAQLTRARVESFTRDRADHVAIHGEELVKGLEYFYTQIQKLFEGGHCGGVRVVVRKPITQGTN